MRSLPGAQLDEYTNRNHVHQVQNQRVIKVVDSLHHTLCVPPWISDERSKGIGVKNARSDLCHDN